MKFNNFNVYTDHNIYIYVVVVVDVDISGINYNTVDSRKTPKNKRYLRKGSVGPPGQSSSE